MAGPESPDASLAGGRSPPGMIAVEVVRLLGHGRLHRLRLCLPEGSTVAVALRAAMNQEAGSQAACGERSPWRSEPSGAPLLAIWGRRCTPDKALREGDRVEWLLPLSIDPKEARRLRHAHHGGLQGGIGRGPLARQRKAQKAGGA